MTRIIAARFLTSADADHAVRLLTDRSIAPERLSVFFVTPPGQHDATPIGGDDHQSEGLEKSGAGAGIGAGAGLTAGVAGAVIAGTAGLAAPIIATAAVGAAAAGAFAGSLAGAMGASEDTGKHRIRHSGMMVAVDAGGVDADVVGVLRDAGALDIEEAEGTWANGTWDDFDPTAPPRLVDGPKVAVSNPAGVN